MDRPRVDVPIPTPRPRRLPRLRIGVGGLMLVILVVGLWLGDRVGRARQQRLAMASDSCMPSQVWTWRSSPESRWRKSRGRF